MIEACRLLEGLASLPPGPELAAALALVDRSRLGPSDVLTVVAARARLVAHEQALLLADLWEAGRLVYAPGAGALDRATTLDRFSADEASFVLRWSVEFTAGQQHLAADLMGRLPKVYQALVAGRIDLVRAAAFSSALVQVDDEVAAAIVDRLLERAQTWTVANLRERLRYHVLRADPGAARKAYDRSVADRGVYARLTGEGSAELYGANLPADRAAAAFDRVDALARAAKADGDGRRLPQLRADAYLDLLTGIAFATRPSRDPLTETADSTHPVAESPPPTAAAASLDLAVSPASGRAVSAGGLEPADPASRVADVEWLSAVGFTDEAGRPFTTTPHAWPAGTFDHGDRDRGGGGSWLRGQWLPGPHPALTPVTVADGVDPAFAAALTGGRLCGCGGIRPPARGGVHIEVSLPTLMCLDDNPALIPGWGPVVADIARQVAAEQERTPPWYWSVVDERGNLLHHGHTRYRPTRAEAAHVRARDRRCLAPGCRKPATWCQLDHQKPHGRGGPSHRGNLCCLSAHHHALRHEHGYVYHRISLGRYLIENSTGRRWPVTPDAHLILTAENAEPGPPPGYVAEIFGYRTDPDYLADSLPAP